MKKIVLSILFSGLLLGTQLAHAEQQSISYMDLSFELPHIFDYMVEVENRNSLNTTCSDASTRFNSLCDFRATTYRGALTTDAARDDLHTLTVIKPSEVLSYEGSTANHFDELLDMMVNNDFSPLFEDADGVEVKDKYKYITHITPSSNITAMISQWISLQENGTYVFAFRPLTSGGDFPPLNLSQIVYWYNPTKDLFVSYEGSFNTQDNSGVAESLYINEYAARDSSGEIDFELYNDMPTALVELMNNYYVTSILPDQLSLEQVAKEMMALGTPGKEQMIYRDILSLDPFADSINYLKQKHVVNGYSDGAFRPSITINRVEFLKILLEATVGQFYGFPSEYNNGCFPDVTTGEWYTKYVCYAKANGIIEGYPDGYFHPDYNINIYEALKIIMNSYDVYTETEPGDAWYSPYFRKAVELQLMFRTLNLNTRTQVYGGDLSITRAEMAELVTQMELRQGN